MRYDEHGTQHTHTYIVRNANRFQTSKERPNERDRNIEKERKKQIVNGSAPQTEQRRIDDA